MNYFLTSTTFYSNQDSQSIFIGCKEGDTPTQISLDQEILDTFQIVTFDSTILVEYCRNRNLILPKSIIDVFQLFKLVTGRPKKYHKLSQTKLIWIIFSQFVEEDEMKSIIEILDYSPKQISETNSMPQLIKFNIFFQQVFFSLESTLKLKQEFERYYKIEKPFNELLCQRQYFGIFISHKLLSEKIERVTKELNYFTKQLRYDYNIFSPQNVFEIKNALKTKNYEYLSKAINTKSFWSFVKSGSEHDKFLKLLYDTYRLGFDKKSLLKIIVENDGKTYPIFDCCGSITSRTLVRMPYVQQLKRSSRDIFVAKVGYTLLYVDYSQFEPGILASLANDETLINCYNQVDLYKSLSIELFGNEQYRPLCKIIFLSFMYGMSIKGLEYLIKDFFHDNNDIKASNISTFFSKFKSLVPYKNELEKIAFEEERVCSCLGNYRYFENKSTATIPSKVKRWILSQKVQGTASLILKTAILQCILDNEIEFLIPMHDAALFQIPVTKLEDKKAFIKNEFENAFLKYCSKIKPKVLFKDFTE